MGSVNDRNVEFPVLGISPDFLMASVNLYVFLYGHLILCVCALIVRTNGIPSSFDALPYTTAAVPRVFDLLLEVSIKTCSDFRWIHAEIPVLKLVLHDINCYQMVLWFIFV
jgi:hypothetical protein